MVVGSMAYDFTGFLADHPGGPEYLRKNAGKVATAEFVHSHPIDVIERTLTKAQLKAMVLGEVDASTIQAGDVAAGPGAAGGGGGAAAAAAQHGALPPGGEKPSIDSCINVYDFEAIATGTLSEQALAYYSSGGDDEITLRENHSAYHRLWLKPRVMVNVKTIDMATKILGHASSFPVFLSAVAMCKMGYPDGDCPGEMAWNRAAGQEGVIYMIPTLSGCAFPEIVGARVHPSQPMFFQLYVNQDRDKTKDLVQRAEKAGCSALFITCDAPQLGNREKDRRVKVTHAGAAVQAGAVATKSEGTAKALTTFIDPSLNWDDLPWFRSITKMKIILKGVGTAEDAVRALEAGCDGVLLSNHGGRQLDFARSALEVLPEAMAALRAHKAYRADKFEVFVDGGVRRGTDIFKALALGAKAVGVGRPALYAMSAFGAAGVAKMLQILKAELEMTMRLMGAAKLSDIKESMVITDNLGAHISPVPSDFLQSATYIPAVTQAQRNRFGRVAAEGGAAAHAAPAAAAAPPPASGEPGLLPAAATLVAAVVKGATTLLLVDVRGGAAAAARALVHNTSLLLLAFCAVHAGGNALLFFGAPAFNGYAAKLMHNPFIRGVEVYLLVAAALHAASGAFLTVKDKKLAPGKDWVEKAKLALTGTLITAFLVVHVQHFRFAPSAFPPLKNGDRDLFRDVGRVLADPKNVALYVGGSAAVGAHALWGWRKAEKKLKDGDGKPLGSATLYNLGAVLVALMTTTFVSVTLYAHLALKA
jgi:L-lactate dehydrogenase (cytochrome)